jgi:hypothetical protein
MSIASDLLVSLTTDRTLTWEEFEAFNQFYFVEIKEFTISQENQIISLNTAPMDYYNNWKLQQDYNGVFRLTFEIKNNEEEYYFLESLIYLIQSYFEPKNIKLNGFIVGFEDVYGFFFRYNVISNSIYFDYERLNRVCDNRVNTNIDETLKALTL